MNVLIYVYANNPFGGFVPETVKAFQPTLERSLACFPFAEEQQL
jgi:hypothetical protein